MSLESNLLVKICKAQHSVPYWSSWPCAYQGRELPILPCSSLFCLWYPLRFSPPPCLGTCFLFTIMCLFPCFYPHDLLFSYPCCPPAHFYHYISPGNTQDNHPKPTLFYYIASIPSHVFLFHFSSGGLSLGLLNFERCVPCLNIHQGSSSILK